MYVYTDFLPQCVCVFWRVPVCVCVWMCDVLCACVANRMPALSRSNMCLTGEAFRKLKRSLGWYLINLLATGQCLAGVADLCCIGHILEGGEESLQCEMGWGDDWITTSPQSLHTGHNKYFIIYSLCKRFVWVSCVVPIQDKFIATICCMAITYKLSGHKDNGLNVKLFVLLHAVINNHNQQVISFFFLVLQQVD